MTYTPEEQAANRETWVAALRSGDFQQGKAQLRDASGKYCCLGVACELAATAGPPDAFAGDGLVPGWQVMAWLGLKDDCGETRKEFVVGEYVDGDPKNANSLTELNDSGEWTFGQIADLIAENGIKLVTDD